jgi:hypothetical protein
LAKRLRRGSSPVRPDIWRSLSTAGNKPLSLTFESELRLVPSTRFPSANKKPRASLDQLPIAHLGVEGIAARLAKLRHDGIEHGLARAHRVFVAADLDGDRGALAL